MWIWIRLSQMVVDILGIYGAFMLAYFWRVGWLFSSDFPFPLFAFLSGLAALVWSGFLILAKYYRVPPRSGMRAWFDVMLVLLGGVVANGLLIVTYFFPRDILFSRLISVYAFGVGILILLASQLIFRGILAWCKKREKNVYRTLIVGANRIAEKFIDAVNRDTYAPHKIIGVIDPYGLSTSLESAPILGKLNKLEDVCKKHNVTCLIQCDAFEHTINLISFCDQNHIKFQFVPALRGIFEENLRLRETAGTAMISFVQRNYSGAKKAKFKFVDAVLHQVFDVD